MEGFQGKVTKLIDMLSQYAVQREQEFARSWNKELSAAAITRAGTSAKELLSDTYEQIQEQLMEICSAYLLMNDLERAAARELVGTSPELLRQLQNHLIWEMNDVKSQADQDRIMRGLAAVSLVDLRIDFRDLMLAMGAAYERAYSVGALLSIPLVKVANISSPIPHAKNHSSMRDFLLNFETSAFFRESVAPKLNP